MGNRSRGAQQVKYVGNTDVLPLVRNTCNTLLNITFLPGRIPKTGKNHIGPFSIVLVYFSCIQGMFDCCLVESYGRKKRQKKRIQVWHTSSSDLWNLGISPTRRHPLVTPEATIQRKKSGQRRFPWLLTWKPKMASRDMLSWSLPKKLAWHVQTYATIEQTIFIFCYVLL